MAQQPAQDDPIIELTERARNISQEAGTKVGGAMREMISAGAGIAGFAVESARDLVQYMVRRGQMAQEEADRLVREAEAVHAKRPKAERERLAAEKLAADKALAAKKAARLAAETALPSHRPMSKTVKTPPPLAKGPGADLIRTAERAVPKSAEKPAKLAAKAPAAPVKAAPVKTAPAKAAAPAKSAPVKAVKASSAKTNPKAASPKPAPAKKAAAKPAAKKAVKKKK